MAEGWLFRLRTSLGAQYSAPAWPSVRDEDADAGASRGLRLPLPERGVEVEPASLPQPGERPR